MSNRIKLKGTTEKSFDLGLVNKFTLDATAFTGNHTWVIPNSDGAPGYVLQTDGSGNLTWAAVGSSSDSTVPYYIPFGDTFVNNLYRQSLFTVPITVDGTLEINGLLVEVN